MPHIEALHHTFGQGVSEIRTDTYLLSTERPEWLMILRGGTKFEIRERTETHGPVSAWRTLDQSGFPIRGSMVRRLKEAFPAAKLPRRLSVPSDLISWLGFNASVCTVSQRIVRFERGAYTAELAQVDVAGVRAETFCLTARRYETVVDTLSRIRGPLLPNIDYGSWLQRRVAPLPSAPVAPNYANISLWRAPLHASPFA